MPSEKLMTQLLELLKASPMDRNTLVDKTDVPRSTLFDALKVLIKQGFVAKGPRYDTEQARGRPKVAFRWTGKIGAVQDGCEKTQMVDKAE